MSGLSRLRELVRGFSRTFWVANTLELFERFAFYGAKAGALQLNVRPDSSPLALAPSPGGEPLVGAIPRKGGRAGRGDRS